MSILNERAHELCDAMAADAERLGIVFSRLRCGTRLIDCGLEAPGSMEAGRRLAEVCLAGLGTVEIVPSKGGGATPYEVCVATDDPVAACMASQYAGWELKTEGYFAMGSGPMRAAAGREELFDTIGHRERPSVCVGVLETNEPPPEAICLDIANQCEVEPDQLTLLIARTASPAGTVQIVARSVETALHKLHTLGCDLKQVARGRGTAPLPPVAETDLKAIGWTNDAILYGAKVTLEFCNGLDQWDEIGGRVPSCASADHGRPFAEIFARYNHDFYRIDPLLFSPAVVVLLNRETGGTREFGRLAPDVLAESFGS